MQPKIEDNNFVDKDDQGIYSGFIIFRLTPEYAEPNNSGEFPPNLQDIAKDLSNYLDEYKSIERVIRPDRVNLPALYKLETIAFQRIPRPDPKQNEDRDARINPDPNDLRLFFERGLAEALQGNRIEEQMWVQKLKKQSPDVQMEAQVIQEALTIVANTAQTYSLANPFVLPPQGLPQEDLAAYEHAVTQLRTVYSQTPEMPQHRLTAYWRLYEPDATKRRALIQTLNERLEVALAYDELAVKPYTNLVTKEVSKNLVGNVPDHWGAKGLNVQGLISGNNVDPIRFADVEIAWGRNLWGNKVTWPLGNKYTRIDGKRHGTAVLGILLGNEVTPSIVNQFVGDTYAASCYQCNDQSGICSSERVAEAICYLISGEPDTNITFDDVKDNPGPLKSGDVLLLEVQRGLNEPTEVDPADFDAIYLAVQVGIIAIEPAGNASSDLNDFGIGLNWRDSGAIIVGAVNSASPQQKHLQSNFGTRIDCWGWGDTVQSINGLFTGTSAASASIAGGVILLQAYSLLKCGQRLPPDEMRKLLRTSHQPPTPNIPNITTLATQITFP